MELVPQLMLPLLTEMGRTEHGEPPDLTSVIQLARDQSRFNRLPDTHIVPDQDPYGVLTERHQEWNELIGPWVHGDSRSAAQRARPRAEPQADGIAQESRRDRVADVLRIRWAEAGRAK